MKKILITGSNGLLGQKLVELLTKNSTSGEPHYQIIATARGENRLPFSEGYEYQSMDITSREKVQEVVANVKPDVIIHTAAMTNVDQCESEKDACWSQNVSSVEYLIEACSKIDCFLLH
ncbi:MAG: sugar nucleotide-binding protein, partial [Emticicia sp.]